MNAANTFANDRVALVRVLTSRPLALVRFPLANAGERVQTRRMQTTHIIIFPSGDPEALYLYTNESFLTALTTHSAAPFMFMSPETRAKIERWYWDGARETERDGVTLVRRSVR